MNVEDLRTREDMEMLFSRPYIKKIHVIIEAVSYIFLIATIIVAAVAVTQIKGDFITRFGGGGDKDSYGSPMTLFIMPAIMLLTNLSMSLVLHLGSDKMFNTGFTVNPKRKNIVLCDFTMMIMLIELELAIYSLLTTIVWIMQNGSAIMLLSMGLTFILFVTIAVLYVIALKHNK